MLCVSIQTNSSSLMHDAKFDGTTDKTQTDDVGVFGSPLSNEYRLVAEHFGLSEPQIRALARKGIEVIFAGPEEKQRLREIMDAAASSVSN